MQRSLLGYKGSPCDEILSILYVATCDLCMYEFHDTVFLRLYVGMCYLKRGNMTSTCVSYFILCESLCTHFMIMYS